MFLKLLKWLAVIELRQVKTSCGTLWESEEPWSFTTAAWRAVHLFIQSSVMPNSLENCSPLPLLWTSCCHDRQQNLHWCDTAVAATGSRQFTEHTACPNRTKFHNALPWILNNIHAKCEVNKMNSSQQTFNSTIYPRCSSLIIFNCCKAAINDYRHCMPKCYVKGPTGRSVSVYFKGKCNKEFCKKCIPQRDSSPKNDNSLIIYSPLCRWSGGWSVWVHKTLLEFWWTFRLKTQKWLS